jgi:hypothetical protein
MDHVFCAEMVADEVLVAAEEEDGHVGEEVGEEVDWGGRVSCAKAAGDGAGTFCPRGLFLGGIDVEGSNYVVALVVSVSFKEEVLWDKVSHLRDREARTCHMRGTSLVDVCRTYWYILLVSYYVSLVTGWGVLIVGDS